MERISLYEEDLKKLFKQEVIKEESLSEETHTSQLETLYKEFKNELDTLNDIEDERVKTIFETISKENITGNESLELQFNNMIMIKRLYYIEKHKQDKENIKDDFQFDLIGELKLKELINLEEYEFSESKDIVLNIEKLQEIVDVEKKWNSGNIVNTISKKYSVNEVDVKLISNLSEYVDFVSKFEQTANYVSRGQKDCSYNLLPSLFRKYDKDFDLHSDAYEGIYKQKVLYYDKDIKNIKDIELRAEGQHFGVPTNFLDFTEAHLISLLFSIEDYEYIDQHSIVHFVDSLNYNVDIVSRNEKLIDYSDPSVVENNKKYSSRSYFIKIGNANERIHFQKGCFLKVAVEDKDNILKKLAPYSKIAIISKEMKKKILEELFHFGITFENIYPDKDNVVKSIRFKYEQMIGGIDRNE